MVEWKRIFYASPNESMDFIWFDNKSSSLYSIANSIFMLENIVKSDKKIPRNVLIDIYVDLNEESIKKIEQLLNILILDVLCEDVAFKLNKKELKKQKLKIRKFSKENTLCLFSGGVDSVTGILKSKETFGSVIGLFINHQDTGKIAYIVSNIERNLLKPKNIPLEKFIAPKMGRGYSQTRGFLYLVYGGILSHFTNAERIIISECGATMYQPKFSPFDTITYTTNPYVLQIAKTVIELILSRSIDVITPFEDFTKTEMMMILSDDNILSKTHSCITSRWGQNCGRCYACLTRMIGSANLGLSLKYFMKNAFEEPDNENLNALINFCYNFLHNRKEIDYWSFNTIQHFNKIELFERLCDDVFRALYSMKAKEILHPNYEFALDEYLKQNPSRINNQPQIKSLAFEKKVRRYEL